MKIGFVSGDWVHPMHTHDGKEKWGGSGWVRIGQYIEYLPQFDWVSGTLVWDRDCFVVRTVQEEFVYVPVIFMHRLMHNGLAENVKKARAAGQIIINDIDDWYWGLDQNNAAFKATHPKFNDTENRNNYRTILANSDLVIVSTPYLASRLDWIRTGMTVVKNTVDTSRFNNREHTSDIPLVGWAGSTAHRSSDLETMKGILPALLNRGEIKLHHSGAHPQHVSFAERIGVSNDQVTTLPLVDHEDYPDILDFDIGIVPLRHTPFNQAKSDIKGMEYAASGIPFIAQRIDAYQELYDSLGIGRLADKANSWLKHIRTLKDPVLRAEEAARQKEAIKARDIQFGAQVMGEILGSFF